MLDKCTNTIVPAVIPHTLDDIHLIVQNFTFVPKIQIDIVDGVFASPASWPYSPAGTPAEAAAVCERFEVQVDIMAVDPLAMAEAWVAAGAHELVIHVESAADLDPFKALRQAAGVAIWLAGNDTLPIERYVAHAADIDGVQLMGITTIGQQGQSQSPRVIQNIEALRAELPELPIQIDGSVNLDTIVDLKTAGATDFVAGSAITKADNPRAAYATLQQLGCR